MTTPSSLLQQMVDIAESRNQDNRERTRIVVQVGHCSESVGAIQISKIIHAVEKSEIQVVTAGCDGACHEGPKVTITLPSGNHKIIPRTDEDTAYQIAGLIKTGVNTESPTDFFSSQSRIAMEGIGSIDPVSIDEYLLQGGYSGLAQALMATPDEVIATVKESGLRGRGGAYFPAAIKWDSARKSQGSQTYLIVNCEEGEPGIFKDRHLMEGIPHRILEGMIIAAYASGSSEAYIYVNAEADLSSKRLQGAVDQAYKSGFLGEKILGSSFSLQVEIRRGAGGYVCGEETTLLNTIEGYRREPRIKPPLPIESGLRANPTVINNAETLASVPFIMTQGPETFAKIGTDDSAGTKIISLSGAVERPGVVEVPMGTTLRQIIYDIGGGPIEGHEITTIAIGGPSSGVFPATMLDTKIAPGQLHESGVMLGAGGVIALDERTDVMGIVRHLANYNSNESCGKCTPCREGTPRIVEALDRMRYGNGSTADIEELRDLADIVELASLCGLGQAAGGPIKSALHFFGDEFNKLVNN